jgi:hypothetical protein
VRVLVPAIINHVPVVITVFLEVTLYVRVGLERVP